MILSRPAAAQFDFPYQPCLGTPDVTQIQTYHESSSKDSKEHDIVYIVPFSKKKKTALNNKVLHGFRQ